MKHTLPIYIYILYIFKYCSVVHGWLVYIWYFSSTHSMFCELMNDNHLSLLNMLASFKSPQIIANGQYIFWSCDIFHTVFSYPYVWWLIVLIKQWYLFVSWWRELHYISSLMCIMYLPYIMIRYRWKEVPRIKRHFELPSQENMNVLL